MSHIVRMECGHCCGVSPTPSSPLAPSTPYFLVRTPSRSPTPRTVPTSLSYCTYCMEERSALVPQADATLRGAVSKAKSNDRGIEDHLYRLMPNISMLAYDM
jgi:hypothetical protein